MLYAVMMRLDSLREIKASLFANVNRFNHLGLKHFPCRSTLSDANKRRDSEIFGSIYMNLYEKYRHKLYSDSPNCGQPKLWTAQMAEESKDNRFYDNKFVF